jgi:hypothetical protein
MQVANGTIVAALDINHNMFVRGGDLKVHQIFLPSNGIRCAILLETGHKFRGLLSGWDAAPTPACRRSHL